MTYRPDIDGLRALAVLGVLAYHLQPSACPGGFVGVDVFFVISGYLITSILWKRSRDGTLSLADFYRRRIRRIFPALLVLLAVWSAVGLLLLMPTELENFGQATAAAAGSVANLFFWYDTDYFAVAAEQRWLLHTWSLGVEEQFYVVLPLAMLGLTRPTTLRAAMVLATFVSFGWSAWLVQTAPTAAFYLPNARAWELLLGSLLALEVLKIPQARWIREGLSVAGLGMLVYAYAGFSSETPFPGPWALVPCLGSLLVIGSGPETVVARLLGVRALVGIGLISYSLYLWHWPLIVLWKHPAVVLPEWLSSDAARIGIVSGASFLAAWLSWRFVETPLRRPRGERGREIRVGIGASVAMAALGLGLWQSAGLPSRLPADVVEIANWARPESRSNNRLGTCFITSAEVQSDYDPALCLGGPGGILVLGDSHAAQLYEGLAERSDRPVLQATASGCKPGLPLRGERTCKAVMQQALDWADASPPELVVMGARWKRRDLRTLGARVDWWADRGVPVLVVGRTVEYSHDLPLLLAHEANGRVGTVERARRSSGSLDRALRERVEQHGGQYLSLRDAICPEDTDCLLMLDEVPLQFDYGHFTSAGSMWASPRILDAASVSAKTGETVPQSSR